MSTTWAYQAKEEGSHTCGVSCCASLCPSLEHTVKSGAPGPEARPRVHSCLLWADQLTMHHSLKDPAVASIALKRRPCQAPAAATTLPKLSNNPGCSTPAARLHLWRHPSTCAAAWPRHGVRATADVGGWASTSRGQPRAQGIRRSCHGCAAQPAARPAAR